MAKVTADLGCLHSMQSMLSVQLKWNIHVWTQENELFPLSPFYLGGGITFKSGLLRQRKQRDQRIGMIIQFKSWVYSYPTKIQFNWEYINFQQLVLSNILLERP